MALPPVEVAVPFETRTVKARTADGLALEVRSVLPKDEHNPRAKPAAPPVSLPLGERFWWTAASLGALCLLLGWLLFRRRAQAAAPAVPALPPFEELAAALDRLAAEPSALRLHTGLSLATAALSRPPARLPGRWRAPPARSSASSCRAASPVRWPGGRWSCCAPATW